ncbi:MAG: inositol monophosphatase family protein [Verrucomicrobiota bacterium JB022]|nr:inositol monophosphatase family protein [Verrucomicrobiota bacterium JB022]
MDLVNNLSIAEEVARKAGRLLQEGRAQLNRVKVEEGHDVKLAADMAAEELIRKELGGTGFPIIGEEQGGDGDLVDGDAFYWIVDPLDGTHNYQRGLPLYCVSIALMQGLQPVIGVIYDVEHDEMFTGGPELPLLRNGEPVEPQWAESRKKASMSTGFPSVYDHGTESVQAFIAHVGGYKKVRMIGTAAIAVAWVACGHFDVYYEPCVRLWDVAAGLALVEAAGGVTIIRRSDTSHFLAFDVWAAGRDDLLPDGVSL